MQAHLRLYYYVCLHPGGTLDVIWNREAKRICAVLFYVDICVHYSYPIFRFSKSARSVYVRYRRGAAFANCIELGHSILVCSAFEDSVLSMYVRKPFCLSSLCELTRNAHRRLNLVVFNGFSRSATWFNLHILHKNRILRGIC